MLSCFCTADFEVETLSQWE